MQLEELIVHALAGSARDVFSTMLGVELGSGESFVEGANPEANDGVVALVGVAGPWTGTGSLSCSPQLACRICARMLLTEADSVNEEVLDAVAELTNMIIGGAKNELELALGPLGLSIPTVVYGHNFKTKSAIHGDWVVVRFNWEGEPIEARLCLGRTEKAAYVLPHGPASVSCAVDV
ncbi:MAG TPA: chemotaxis protein CheX [Bryobacteraceae bacterium]|nr:chemotaxis protein CheX [Bryobacteraceae bacterium]